MYMLEHYSTAPLRDDVVADMSSRSPLGKLPPLQSIGRSQSIDLDDPPDLEDEFDAFATQYDNEAGIYYYTPDHAPKTAEALATAFQLLQPGGHVSKQHAAHVPMLSHCRFSVEYADKYAELRQLLEAKARLELVRDYTSRLNAAAIFVVDIESIVREEYATWHEICHNTLSSAPTTKLECLSAVCDDLRLHMNHWNSLKTRVHTDRWLRSQLPSLSRHLTGVHERLHRMYNDALFWIQRLIHVGFRVLAHCDTAQLTQDMLWAITRGLEEFNNITTMLIPTTTPSSSSSSSPSLHMHVIKPVLFPHILDVLACERAKYAAAMTHQFFTASDDFMELLLRTRMPDYTWGEDIIRPGLRTNSTGSGGEETSDYHTDSQVSLSTAMLRVGSVIAPDLSRHMSPIVDFTRREQEFAGKFFHIVCASTSLLKKPANVPPAPSSSAIPTPRTKRVSLRYQNHPNFKPDKLPPVISASPPSAPRTTKSDNDVLTPLPTDSEPRKTKSSPNNRKSVSWGDSAEIGIIQQLTYKYLDLMWGFFGRQLAEFFVAPVHGGVEATTGQLGNIMLCKDMVTILIVRMIQQTCLKDIFPPGAVLPLTTVAKKLHADTAWAAWDADLCSALASRVVDKCTAAILLVSGDHSTKTGRLLRDVYQPLHSVLASLELSKYAEGGDKANEAPQLSLLVPTLRRLVCTCDVSQRWCDTKIHQHLTSWSLPAFLLVSQSDLKLISDESRHVLFECQKVCSRKPSKTASAAEHLMYQQLASAWDELSAVTAQMQSLSGFAVKQFSESCSRQAWEFFDDNMPTGKIWRKKNTAELPSAHQEYVEHALDTLLEPVVAGVAKLKTTSQISAVSMATTAVCEAWTDYILKQKIRFSLHGAHQLSVDFAYVRSWLQGMVQADAVKQSVLALDIFKYLGAAVDLLKRQPRGGRRSQDNDTRSYGAYRVSPLVDNTSPALSNSSSSCDVGSSPQQWTTSELPSLNNGSSTSPEHSDYKVPHREQWLALRVQGGARHWPKLPSCFNTTNQ